MHNAPKRDTQIAYAVIGLALIFVAAAFVTALAITGSITSQSTPFISGVLALVGVLLPAILSMIRSVENREMTREVDRKVNGHLARLTEAAVNAGVKPEDLPPLPPGVETPGESK